jgi:uncharacterized GH25 family protein
MQISNIVKKTQNLEKSAIVTFADNEGYDFLTITISKDDMWQIARFVMEEMSWTKELKK